MRRVCLGLGLFLLASGLGLSARADERADAVKKQTAAAEKNLKAAKMNAPVIETDDLLVFTTIPSEKAKTLATAMQKSFTAAVKGLKVEMPDKLWPGKLTVYIFTEPRQYKLFALDALKKPIQNRETFSMDLRSEIPVVITTVGQGEKPTDATLHMEAGTLVAAAVLNKQAGAGNAVPEWLQLGFGRAAYLRAEGNSAKLTAHKAKVKAMYGKTGGAAFKISNITSGQTAVDSDLLATSLAEYLAYGPSADKFSTLLGALKPTDDNQTPSLETAFGALEWKSDWVDGAWRKWVATGK